MRQRLFHLLTLWLCAACPTFAAAAATEPVARPDAVAVGGAVPADPLPPFIAAPQPAPRSLVPQRFRPWLPEATPVAAPRLLAVDRSRPVRQRPMPDVPDIASMPPLGRRLRTGPAAYAAYSDAGQVAGMKLGVDAGHGLSPRIAALPGALAVRPPRRLPSDGPQATRLRPTADYPPLAWDTDPFSPRPPSMPITARAYGLSPDPAQSPMLSAAFLPLPDRPALAGDPTWSHSAESAIARRVELDHKAAPFLRLTIPDPYELIALVQLRKTPPDADPPSQAPGLPSRFTFPVKP